MINLVLSNNPFEPEGYAERKTVRAVVVNDAGEILLLGSYPLGGGVEDTETYEEALHREVMEEGGVEVTIMKPLGEIIGYADDEKRKYVVRGYLCKNLKTASAPTTTDPHEFKYKLNWSAPAEAISRLESEIDELKKLSSADFEGRKYSREARIHNRTICLEFIKEAFK